MGLQKWEEDPAVLDLFFVLCDGELWEKLGMWGTKDDHKNYYCGHCGIQEMKVKSLTCLGIAFCSTIFIGITFFWLYCMWAFIRVTLNSSCWKEVRKMEIHIFIENINNFRPKGFDQRHLIKVKSKVGSRNQIPVSCLTIIIIALLQAQWRISQSPEI